MKKKKKYAEQYSTCIFMARATYYTATGTNNDLAQKCKKIIWPLEEKAPIFGGSESFTKLGEILGNYIPPISFLFRLPFIKNYFSSNIQKDYQTWCKTFDGVFTVEEQQQIIKENLMYDEYHDGPGMDTFGETAWTLLKESHKYVPIISEIKWLYNKKKHGVFFVS